MHLRGRSRSMPADSKGVSVKGILKYSTVDASMHAKYGRHAKKNGQESLERGIEFKDIQIREYARTVGDNPSCSSGPPVA